MVLGQQFFRRGQGLLFDDRQYITAPKSISPEEQTRTAAMETDPAVRLSATYKKPVIDYHTSVIEGSPEWGEDPGFAVNARGTVAYTPQGNAKSDDLARRLVDRGSRRLKITERMNAGIHHEQVGELAVHFPRPHAAGHGAEIGWINTGDVTEHDGADYDNPGNSTQGLHAFKRQGIGTEMLRTANSYKPFSEPIEHSADIYTDGKGWRDSAPEKRPINPWKNDVIHMTAPGRQEQLRMPSRVERGRDMGPEDFGDPKQPYKSNEALSMWQFRAQRAVNSRLGGQQ